MITKDRLDDVVKRVEFILKKECGAEIPFVLIILEPFANEVEIGISMRATGNAHEEMARDMITKAAMHILETEDATLAATTPPEKLQ
jgi:hypothetical protein